MPSKDSKKDYLTNEKVKAQFTNQFDLVNTAISFARDIIRGQREPSEDTDNKNVAVQALIELTNINEEKK